MRRRARGLRGPTLLGAGAARGWVGRAALAQREHGGLGLSLPGQVVIYEEDVRVDAPSPTMFDMAFVHAAATLIEVAPPVARRPPPADHPRRRGLVPVLLRAQRRIGSRGAPGRGQSVDGDGVRGERPEDLGRAVQTIAGLGRCCSARTDPSGRNGLGNSYFLLDLRGDARCRGSARSGRDPSVTRSSARSSSTTTFASVVEHRLGEDGATAGRSRRRRSRPSGGSFLAPGGSERAPRAGPTPSWISCDQAPDDERASTAGAGGGAGTTPRSRSSPSWAGPGPLGKITVRGGWHGSPRS